MTPPRSRRSADLAARAALIAGGGERPAAAAESTPAASTSPTPPPAPPPPPAGGGAPRTRPVRVTVELQPVEHRGLRRLCETYADELGVTQVAGAEVLRVLLDLARTDPALAARVGAELARTGGTRRR